MSYPLRVSLQRANELTRKLTELSRWDEYQTADEVTQVSYLVAVLFSFGVDASSTVKVFDGSPFSSSVLKYLSINLEGVDDTIDEYFADWYAGFEVTGVDMVDILIHEFDIQGC